MEIYYVIGLLVVGGIIALVARPRLLKAISRFRDKAPLVRKYWLFIAPFSILTALAYIIVWRYFYNEITFSVLGQISGLILAIFVGYIAFAELSENRFDKTFESGMNLFTRGQLASARMKLEEAHSLKPNEISVLGNLLELYLIIGKNDKFASKIKHYQSIIIEKHHQLNYYYLVTLDHLLHEHLKDARKSIADSVEYLKDNPDARNNFSWSNLELQTSETYKKLGSAAKKLQNNHFNYLKGHLDADMEKLFTSGNYELDKPHTK